MDLHGSAEQMRAGTPRTADGRRSSSSRGPAPVPFDPSMPEAGRWRRWLHAGLRDRGIPPDARLDLALRPHGEVSVARLQLDLRWKDAGSERHAHAEVLIPLRRLLGPGWSGWPAYQAGVNLLRLLD